MGSGAVKSSASRKPRAAAVARHLQPSDWVAAARKVLVVSGVDDVKVDRLAKKLKVTRGSFYWHFKHRNDLLNALLQDWEVRNRVEIAQIEDRWELAEPDLSEVVAIWLGEDPAFPAFDLAIRVWARKTPAVMSVVRRIDDAWVALLTGLFRRSGMSEEESFVRGRVIYFHQIGYYALGIEEAIADRVRLAPTYYRVLTGAEPTKTHGEVLARFREPPAAARKPRKPAAKRLDRPAAT